MLFTTATTVCVSGSGTRWLTHLSVVCCLLTPGIFCGQAYVVRKHFVDCWGLPPISGLVCFFFPRPTNLRQGLSIEEKVLVRHSHPLYSQRFYKFEWRWWTCPMIHLPYALHIWAGTFLFCSSTIFFGRSHRSFSSNGRLSASTSQSGSSGTISSRRSHSSLLTRRPDFSED